MDSQSQHTSIDMMTEKSETNRNTARDVVGMTELSRQFYLIFLSMSILALAAAFSTTSVTVSLVSIAAHFDLTTTQAFWLGTSTALTATVVQPGCASFADILGRRWALTSSAAMLALGALLAAVAQNYATIITGRSLQGVGVGGIFTITEIIITDLVPLRLRGIWFAFLSVFSAIGTCSGPILSGVLTKTASWRWIFAISVLTTVVAMVACFITLPVIPRRGKTMELLRRVDYIGFLMLSASLICFLVPLMQAGVVYPWTHVKTLAPLTTSTLGFAAFFLFELKYARSPLVPLSRFTNRTTVLAFMCACAHGLALWCLMYYVPLYYEFIKGFDTLKTGVAMLPESLSIVLGATAAGYLVSWTGKYRWMIWLGWIIAAIGMGVLYLLNENTSTSSWVGLNIPVGLGMGYLFGSLQFAIQAAVEPQELPLAVTLFMFWRSFGASLGISIGGAIFSSALPSDMSPPFPQSSSPSMDHAAVSEKRSVIDIMLMSIDARLSGLRRIWLFCLILCLIMLLASFGIKSFSIDSPDIEKKEKLAKDEEE